MTTRIRVPRRLLAVFAATLLTITGIGVAAAATSTTQAAWNDRVYVSAVATASTWTTPVTNSCVAMNADGTVKSNGYCSVTSVVVQAEWGGTGNRTRNYNVTFNTNADRGYIQFTINLAPTGTSTFTWSTAGLARADSPQVTPNTGWTCSQLPKLTGKTPTDWSWGSNSQIYFQIVENRATNSVVCP